MLQPFPPMNTGAAAIGRWFETCSAVSAEDEHRWRFKGHGAWAGGREDCACRVLLMRHE